MNFQNLAPISTLVFKDFDDILKTHTNHTFSRCTIGTDLEIPSRLIFSQLCFLFRHDIILLFL